MEQIVRVLAAAGANLDAADHNGVTTLHNATQIIDSSVVKVLIELGASPNVRTHRGMTPLMDAANQCHGDMIQALIAAGADVNAVDAQGNTPLMFAISGRPTQTHLNDNRDSVIGLLLDAGADSQIVNFEGKNARVLAQHRGLPKDVRGRLSHTRKRQT
jgi:cytohesin